MALVFLAPGAEVALELGAGPGRGRGDVIGPAALGAQHQSLGALVALLAPNARLAHALPRHLLAVVAHRPEQRASAGWGESRLHYHPHYLFVLIIFVL